MDFVTVLAYGRSFTFRGRYESLSKANTSLARIRKFEAQANDAFVNLQERRNAQIDIIEARTVKALEQAKAKCEAESKRAVPKLEAEANNKKVALNSEIQVESIELQTVLKDLDSVHEYNYPSDISFVRPSTSPENCDQCLMRHEISPPFYRGLESSGQCLRECSFEYRLDLARKNRFFIRCVACSHNLSKCPSIRICSSLAQGNSACCQNF